MKYFTLITCLLLTIVACKKGDLKAPVTYKPCADTIQRDIVSVSGPTSTSPNQEIIFNVTWKGGNSCDSFVNFKQDTAADIINIKAYAAHDSCTICEPTTGLFKSASYKFKPAGTGVYYLKFYKSGILGYSVIIDTVVVN